MKTCSAVMLTVVKKKKQVGCSRTGHGSSRNIIITTGSYYKGNIKGELVNKLKC